jgi:BMFP domain-containing protein YqiC
MLDDSSDWLDAVLVTLARARAMLACFGARDRELEARIDHALDLASALKRDAVSP